MRPIRAAAIVLLLGQLAGCGFSPLYAEHDGHDAPSAALSQISVGLIPDRTGQELRQALQERLERAGQGVSVKYDLYVTISIAGNPIAIDQQSASTRVRQNASATWVLRAQDAGHTQLASSSAHALDGFDIINQQFFAADLSSEAATRRIVEALAEQITQQLAVYFRQHPPA